MIQIIKKIFDMIWPGRPNVVNSTFFLLLLIFRDLLSFSAGVLNLKEKKKGENTCPMNFNPFSLGSEWVMNGDELLDCERTVKKPGIR